MHIDQITVISFFTLVAAVILHEIAHGVVAFFFGDNTAREAGRLTLNPIPHIDPFGSIILPAMGALSGIPIIGFAKPVPVNPSRMRNPRRDMLMVSLAGPGSNLLLMFGSAFVARSLFQPPFLGLERQSLAVQITVLFATVNLFLGLFNLVPIPPLDGAALLERILPREWLPAWHRFRPYGMLVIFGLVFWGGLPGHLFDPFLNRLYGYILR